MTRTLLALLALSAVFVIACGDGSSAEPEPTATPAPPSAIDDEGYLALLCEGLDSFSDAVQTATTEEQLAAVIQLFIDDLDGVAPPADVAAFHEAFTNYLIAALDDPTSPLVTLPPMPDDEVRDRLAKKEGDVPECENATFFRTDS